MIQTHIITGGLGVGKTTAILSLLAQKPGHERWAVLVNEFGQVGIDGATFSSANQGVAIKEIPGGCLCCVAGVPFQVGLGQLIRQAKPDRLLIEPSGLGHPKQILQALQGKWFKPLLQLGAHLTLVDPRKLRDPKWLDGQTWRDQIAIADVLIANRLDQCQTEDMQAWQALVDGLAAPQPLLWQTQQGELPLSLLLSAKVARPWQLSVHPLHPTSALINPGDHTALDDYQAVAPSAALAQGQTWQRFDNQGQGMLAVGWLLQPQLCLPFEHLMTWAAGLSCQRMKALLPTTAGWHSFQWVEGALTVRQSEPLDLGRVELIDQGSMAEDIDRWQRLLTVTVNAAEQN